MADMDIFEFAAMIEETPVKSRVVEYSAPATGDRSRQLTAVCLTDVLDDGVSMVYSFYAPERLEDSLGTYIILDHVEIAREQGLPYVYLGYWVPGSRKMGYKSNFAALEIYKQGRWQSLGKTGDHDADVHPLSVDPIAEQVARISLPETRPVRG
jgi:arginine-tRNA-protein transferase